MDVERLAEGLWRWVVDGAGSVYYEAPDAVVLFDPVVPAGEEAGKFLAYLDRDVERLGLPVSILLTDTQDERSAAFLRERYRAGDRVPASVEAHPVDGAPEHQLAYYIEPHRVLVVATSSVSVAAPEVERVLVSNPAHAA